MLLFGEEKLIIKYWHKSDKLLKNGIKQISEMMFKL